MSMKKIMSLVACFGFTVVCASEGKADSIRSVETSSGVQGQQQFVYAVYKRGGHSATTQELVAVCSFVNVVRRGEGSLQGFSTTEDGDLYHAMHVLDEGASRIVVPAPH